MPLEGGLDLGEITGEEDPVPLGATVGLDDPGMPRSEASTSANPSRDTPTASRKMGSEGREIPRKSERLRKEVVIDGKLPGHSLQMVGKPSLARNVGHAREVIEALPRPDQGEEVGKGGGQVAP